MNCVLSESQFLRYWVQHILILGTFSNRHQSNLKITICKSAANIMSEKNCGCLEIFNLETSSQHNLEVPDYSELTLNFKLYDISSWLLHKILSKFITLSLSQCTLFIRHTTKEPLHPKLICIHNDWVKLQK